MLTQTTLNQVFTNIIRENLRPNREDEAGVINQENFRLRQLGDSLIVDVSKSTGRFIETLSEIQYLFPNVIEINKKINNIIQMQQSLVDVFERGILIQFNEDIIREISTPVQIGGITSEQINQLRNTSVNRASDEIFNWIITNIIVSVENIENDLLSEFVEKTYHQKLLNIIARFKNL